MMEESFLTSRQKAILFSSIGIFCIVVFVAFIFTPQKKESSPEVAKSEEKVSVVSPIATPVNEATSASSSSLVNKGQDDITKDYRYLFTDPPQRPGHGNVVGYVGYTFALSLPLWLSEQWVTTPTPTSFKGMDITAFTPREPVGHENISDIRIESRSSTEEFNAQYLYGLQKEEYEKRFTTDAPIVSYTFEFFYNNSGNLLIYHIEKRLSTGIGEEFYIDSGGRTAIITFSATGAYKEFYTKKVIDFVKGFESNNLPQG